MYSDERSWAGVLMKKVQAISIMIAAAMLFSISACGIPTGSGVPEPVAAPDHTAETPNREEGKADIQVLSVSEAGYKVHSLEEYIDTEETFCIGYDAEMNSIVYFVRGDNENTIWGINVDSKDIVKLIELPIEDGQYYFGIIYSEGWIVWTEHADRDVYVGVSTGANWKIRAANISTGEVVDIDGADESFPSGVFATPWGISCNGEYVAYCGYDTDEDGNVCCVVKAYGLDSHELITITSYPYSGFQVFGDPCLGDGFVAYAAYFNIGHGDFTTNVYYFDLNTHELTELQSDGNISSLAASDEHIFALEQRMDEHGTRSRKAIVMYNGDEWQTIIDHSSPMYSSIGEEYVNFETLETWGNYVSWRNLLDDGYYIYDISNNKAVEIISAKSDNMYAGGVHFNSPFLCWSEYCPDTGSSNTSFVILE